MTKQPSPHDPLPQSSQARPEPATQPEGEQPPITGQIFERHVFVCTDGDSCAGVDGDAWGIHGRLKKAVALDPRLKGRVRINKSGCLDQCGFGPMIVIYPDNVWYWAVEPDDVDEIVRKHLIGGQPVERLVYRNKPGKNKLPRDECMRPIGRPPAPPRPARTSATPANSREPVRQEGRAAT